MQDGKDDCGEYFVPREKLKELRDSVTTVLQASKLVPGTITNGYSVTRSGTDFVEEPILQEGQRVADASVAEAVLPTQAGFFFGSTDYDQYYYDDLQYTSDALTRLLAEADDGDFYYSSSW